MTPDGRNVLKEILINTAIRVAGIALIIWVLAHLLDLVFTGLVYV
jgi:hypothetical protein